MASIVKNVNTFSDYGTEAQDIDRRRKMAEMLQQQALMPIEQSSAGGYVTPISWTQGLAKALQGYAGMKGQERATQEQRDLAGRAKMEATDYFGGMPQAKTTDLNPVAMDDEGNTMPPALQTTQPTRQEMMSYALKGSMSGNPLVQPVAGSMLAQYMKPEEDKVVGPGASLVRGSNPIYTAPFKPDAPDKPDYNKPFNPDGTPNKAYQDYQERLRREGKPSVSVTVPVNTEKKYGEAFAGKVADADVSLRDAAEKAPQLAERANRIKQVLASGNAITGFGADFRLGFGKAAALAGLESAADAAANTETLAAGLAQNTMDAIKASGMGGGTGFSNADRDFLEKAVGGRITLEPQAISRLADLAHRAASMTADRWTKRASQIPKSAIEGTGIDISPVRVPALGAKSADTPSASKQPQLPQGIPDGSVKIGTTPDGRPVYKAPNGKQYVP